MLDVKEAPQTRGQLTRHLLELEEELRELDGKISAATGQRNAATIAFVIGLVVFIFFHWLIGGFILLVAVLAYFTQKSKVGSLQKHRNDAHEEHTDIRVELSET